MSLAIRVLMMVGLVACITSVAHAIAGQATFTPVPILPTACFGSQDTGVMIAAVNNRLFGNGSACGRRYRVICTGSTSSVPQPCRGNSVVVTVVDRCPSCNSDQFDLSQEAFAIIADPNVGRIYIDYTQV